MLDLKNIVKIYRAGDQQISALKGISIRFRKSEFVSVLGPSGCGKTTLLNIIGGLDSYNEGDLVIAGRSTSQFKNADWDTYRNHSVGFVFQSYNLIPHQTVLANVELALTLSGVSRAERRRRAKEALARVGLTDQIHKKPNQMSGGQMQRVAIARALVNDPEIILADEPTGALDSETSVQIMEILKEISRDKLIIMVTHNPDLAEQYSSRIVRLLDGEILSDSDPAPEEEQATAVPKASKRKRKEKKPSMGFFTALFLSFNNLLTKKGRTFMTSFAGSIGIIGIALILSVSNGVQGYIDTVQKDTLSSYPITIEAESVDLTSVLSAVMGGKAGERTHDTDQVYSSSGMQEMLNAMSGANAKTNDLKEFKEYLDDENSEIKPYVSAVKYGYSLKPSVYSKDAGGEILKSDALELMQELFGTSNTATSGNNMYQNYQKGFEVWEEMLAGEGDELVHPILKQQYDLIYGSWPTSYDQVVLVLDKNNEVSDISLYALGLESKEEMTAMMQAYMNGKEIQSESRSWSYQEICDRTFRLILPADAYQYDAATGKVTDISSDETGLRFLYDNGLELHVSGILRPNKDAAATMMQGAIGYTEALSRYMAEEAAKRPIVQAQLRDQTVDIFTGLPFDTGVELTGAEKAAAFKQYAEGLEPAGQAALYRRMAAIPSQAYLDQTISQMLSGMDRAAIESKVKEAAAASSGMDEATINQYIASMDDDTLKNYVKDALTKQLTAQYAAATQQQLSAFSDAQLAALLRQTLPGYTEEELTAFYNQLMPATTSDATLSGNEQKLGYVDLESPTEIALFADTFENKNKIADCIATYNAGKAEDQQITYTDYVALLMSSVTKVLNAISYVLIAFVAISLVVSSIMIGIITYISVLERTKEIGILRAMGASRRDISRVFNAETLIVGFAAGALGILITLGLNLIINLVLHAVTHIPSLNASLPMLGGVVLVGISMLLTYVAGLIPSGIAAKKDPVEALRSE